MIGYARDTGNNAVIHVETNALQHHLSGMPKRKDTDIELIRTWTLSTTVTMGSAVRAKGQKAAYQAKLTRSLKKKPENRSRKSDDEPVDPASKLRGWEEFDVDGLLR